MCPPDVFSDLFGVNYGRARLRGCISPACTAIPVQRRPMRSRHIQSGCCTLSLYFRRRHTLGWASTRSPAEAVRCARAFRTMRHRSNASALTRGRVSSTSCPLAARTGAVVAEKRLPHAPSGPSRARPRRWPVYDPRLSGLVLLAPFGLGSTPCRKITHCEMCTTESCLAAGSALREGPQTVSPRRDLH
jgi:hypothetical protein